MSREWKSGKSVEKIGGANVKAFFLSVSCLLVEDDSVAKGCGRLSLGMEVTELVLKLCNAQGTGQNTSRGDCA